MVLYVNRWWRLVDIYAVYPVQELSCWITDTQSLFFKIPRPGHPRLRTCPACRDQEDSPVKMSALHVLRDCKAVSSARAQLGITRFFTDFDVVLNEGISPMSGYLNGFDKDGVRLSGADHRNRGKNLITLRETWQSTWCDS